MFTAGYVIKHTPSLTALSDTAKIPNRQLTKEHSTQETGERYLSGPLFCCASLQGNREITHQRNRFVKYSKLSKQPPLDGSRMDEDVVTLSGGFYCLRHPAYNYLPFYLPQFLLKKYVEKIRVFLHTLSKQ